MRAARLVIQFGHRTLNSDRGDPNDIPQDVHRVCSDPCFLQFHRTSCLESKQVEINSADRLFQTGKFDEAGKIYAQIASQIPRTMWLFSSWSERN